MRRIISRYFSSGKSGRSRVLLSSTAATEAAEASHTAGIMSNGAAEPFAARTAATVDGIIWMDAVFNVISRSTVSGAPRLPASVYSRSAAHRPSGVAALDRPSKFAVTFALTASIASRSFAALPNSGRSKGIIKRDSLPAKPEAWSSSITPLQKHISPAMLTAREIASAAPVLTAAVTASSRPVAAPHTKAAAKKITHTVEINPSFPLTLLCVTKSFRDFVI